MINFSENNFQPNKNVINLNGFQPIYDKNNIYNDDNIEILEYNILPPIPNEENLVDLMREIGNSIIEYKIGTRDVLESIYNLRRLLKTHPEIFIVTFDNLVDHFPKLLNDTNPNILAVSLTLISDIFQNLFLRDEIRSWLKFILTNKIMKHFNSRNNIVKEKINFVYFTLIENVFFPETIELLIFGCRNNEMNLSQISLDYLLQHLSYYDEDFLSGTFEIMNWTKTLSYILKIYEKTHKSYQEKAFIILQFFDEKFTAFFDYEYLHEILSNVDDLDFIKRFENMFIIYKNNIKI